jgi:YrbI family 3-deoxy-D-manno-octulosonate 8-phosphate phosphatase
VTRVAVVTGDAELRQLALDAGTDAIEPPAAGGGAAMLLAVLEVLAGRDGFAPALAVLLDPAYPLCTTETIDAAIEHLWRCGADSLIAVRPLDDGLWVQDEGGLARPFDRGPAERRYVETGAIAGVRIGVFERTGELPTGRIVLCEVPALAGLRLEEGADWGGAELLLRQAAASRGKALLRSAKLLVFDFDGVMTDNRVLVFEDGREAVLCNRGDGMGLDLLKQTGLVLAVISKEVNPVVGARCRKLKIPCEQGIDDKLDVLERLMREHGLQRAQVAYMGNDVNDLECMAAAGVAIVPADAHPLAVRAADLVTAAPGGFGAVREVCDLILAARTEEADRLELVR